MPHVDPEPAPEPAAPEPANPLDPESPNAASAFTSPYNLETFKPSATDVASTAPIDTPQATEAPSPTGAPSPTDVPSPSEAPTPTDAPSPTQAPSATGVPSQTDVPSPSEAPTPTDAPSPTQAPSATGVPSPTDVPSPSEAPTPTDAPSPTQAPSATEAPSPTGDPSATEDPQPTDATAATDGVQATNVPAATDGTDPPDLICSSNPQNRLARRCPASDAAKDADSGGAGDEPIVSQPEGSSYDDIAAGLTNRALNGLNDAIRTNAADKQRADYSDAYIRDPLKPGQNVGGLLQTDTTHLISPNLANAFADRDIMISTKVQFIRTQIRTDPGEVGTNAWSAGDETPTVCDAAFSTDGKVVIAVDSQRGNDVLQDTDKRKLWWSEFIFQQMQGFVGTSNGFKNLQWFVRNKVSSGQTLQTVHQVFPTLKIPWGQKLVLRSSDTGDLGTAFDAMSRTVNVKGVNWLLADHHNAFGNKMIKTIVIIPNGATAVDVDTGKDIASVDIFLELG